MTFGKSYDKLQKYFENCSPLYGVMIMAIFTFFGVFLKFRYNNITETEILYIGVKTGIYILYFGLVLFLCKKKYNKIAYFIAYFPLIFIMITSVITYYYIYPEIQRIQQIAIAEEQSQAEQLAQSGSIVN